MIQKNKNLLRKELLKKRSNLKKEEVAEKSNLITSTFISQISNHITDFKKKSIAIYQNINNEVETKNLINFFFEKNIIISLPKINPSLDEMDFILYKEDSKLANNEKYKNIQEPTDSKIILPDIIILPLVACDKDGNRIGMGKGFYDKKIFELKTKGKKPILIGLSYNFQILKKIPKNSHDEKLDLIICEDCIIKS